MSGPAQATMLHSNKLQAPVQNAAAVAASAAANTNAATARPVAPATASTTPAVTPLVGQPDFREMDNAVRSYLRQRGFKRTEQTMNTEPATAIPTTFDTNAIANALNFNNSSRVDCYEIIFHELRDWVDGSLDLYKSELHSIVYPLLVHCFLELVRIGQVERARAFLDKCGAEFMDGAAGRREELMALRGVSSQLHIEENETARLFLDNRYQIHLTSYAKELVYTFLHDDNRRTVLLKILNQRCIIHQNTDGGTRAGGFAKNGVNEAEAGSGFVSARDKIGLLKHELLWGRLRPELYMIPDEFEVEKTDTVKDKENGSSEGPMPMSGITNANGSAAVPAKKDITKKDSTKKDGGKDDKEEDQEPHMLEDGTISASRIPLKRYRPKQLGLETEDDLKARAKLGWQRKAKSENITMKDDENDDSDEECVLPSVLCYTFTNTKGEGLNCSSVSTDGAQVAGGFGDSSVRLWDSRVAGTTGGGLGSRATRLIGHAGPVYSVDWTRCGRFVISGSEDSTVRLWSTRHKADVVAYRGHNYPVWSVKFAPLDHYFVSAGHDRTARVWSTDRVYPLRILAGHLADVDTVRWHPNCQYIATGSSDRTARLWDLRNGMCVRVFGARSTVHALAFAPDGTKLAVAGDDSGIDVWDMRYAKRSARLEGHRGTVWALDYSLEGAVLASGSADRSVALWDGAKLTSKPHAILRTKDTPIHSVAFTRRNLLIACGNYAH